MSYPSCPCQLSPLTINRVSIQLSNELYVWWVNPGFRLNAFHFRQHQLFILEHFAYIFLLDGCIFQLFLLTVLFSLVAFSQKNNCIFGLFPGRNAWILCLGKKDFNRRRRLRRGSLFHFMQGSFPQLSNLVTYPPAHHCENVSLCVCGVRECVCALHIVTFSLRGSVFLCYYDFQPFLYILLVSVLSVIYGHCANAGSDDGLRRFVAHPLGDVCRVWRRWARAACEDVVKHPVAPAKMKKKTRYQLNLSYKNIGLFDGFDCLVIIFP